MAMGWSGGCSKTLCGGLYGGAFPIGPNETRKGQPIPLAWLRILFGQVELAWGQGLCYIPRKEGEPVTTNELVLRFEVLRALQAPVIGGVRVWFLGFEFGLLMRPIPPGVPTLFDGGLFRPLGLMDVVNNTRIHFHWKGGAGSDPIFMPSQRET